MQTLTTETPPQIPDVHDSARYECLHNGHLGLEGLADLYDVSKNLADCCVPQEYGVMARYKNDASSIKMMRVHLILFFIRGFLFVCLFCLFVLPFFVFAGCDFRQVYSFFTGTFFLVFFLLFHSSADSADSADSVL